MPRSPLRCYPNLVIKSSRVLPTARYSVFPTFMFKSQLKAQIIKIIKIKIRVYCLRLKVYMHDPKDAWFQEHGETRPLGGGEQLDVLYRLRTSESEDSARLLSLESRGCLLQGELPGYPVYSQSLCRLRCLAAEQAHRCSCTHHLLPSLGIHIHNVCVRVCVCVFERTSRSNISNLG